MSIPRIDASGWHSLEDDIGTVRDSWEELHATLEAEFVHELAELDALLFKHAELDRLFPETQN